MRPASTVKWSDGPSFPERGEARGASRARGLAVREDLGAATEPVSSSAVGGANPPPA